MKLMNRLTVGRKLGLITGFAVLALVAMTVAQLVSKRNVMQADRKEQVRIAVEGAWGVVDVYARRVAAGRSWQSGDHNGRRRRRCGRFATAAPSTSGSTTVRLAWSCTRSNRSWKARISPSSRTRTASACSSRWFRLRERRPAVRGLHVATTRQRYRGCEGVVRQGVRALGLGGRLRGLSRRHRCGDPEGCLDHRRDRPVVDRPGCRLLDLHQSQHRHPAVTWRGGCRRDRQGQTRQ